MGKGGIVKDKKVKKAIVTIMLHILENAQKKVLFSQADVTKQVLEREVEELWLVWGMNSVEIIKYLIMRHIKFDSNDGYGVNDDLALYVSLSKIMKKMMK